MKALTIWQPWASLIIAGAKPYEFRGWRPYRSMIGQRIVIHAAARKMDRQDAGYLLTVLNGRDKWPREAAETCLVPEKALPVLLDALGGGGLPHSVGLGTAILGEPRNGVDIAAEFGLPRANDSDRDEHANWGWPLTEIEAWPEPVVMRGAQGFWAWPTPDRVML